MRALRSIIEASFSASPTTRTMHCQIIKLGTIEDTYTANNLLGTYLKNGQLPIALKLFEEIPQKDAVSWNSLIAGYINNADVENAWEVLIRMKRCGFCFDGYTFGSILKGVASNESLLAGQQVHTSIIKMGYEENVYSGSALLDMYAKCGRMVDAHKCFNSLPACNSVSWNALISGYAETGDHVSSFRLFKVMHREGVNLDDGTFSPLLTLLDRSYLYRLTTQIHCMIIKHGMQSDTQVLNATISAYSECGSIEYAKGVFDRAGGVRDLVTWNAMLAACLEHDKRALAFTLFTEMQVFGFEPDIYTYTTVISSCFEEYIHNQGLSLHALVIKKGFEHSTAISNSLMAMFSGSNGTHMEYVIKIFKNMKFKDRVSWNSILTGLSQHGFSENALKVFQIMQSENMGIDYYSFSAVLRSCADLATLHLGQLIHGLAVKSGFESNEFVTSSLVVMYSKCGIINDARRSFETSNKQSSVSWNSIIFAYAQHGLGHVALFLFSEMTKRNVKHDHITFVAVLTACSHIGLVEKGSSILKNMEHEYGISPRMEHYACMIDLFGRAGRLTDAKELIKKMPFQPDTMVWKTLLGACRLCGDVELATQVADLLLESEPYEHCTYVLLCELYGNLKKWDEIAGLKRIMKDKKVKKVPGWSWIEVENKMHSFSADGRSHSRNQEIYQMLQGLTEGIANLDSESLMDDTD